MEEGLAMAEGGEKAKLRTVKKRGGSSMAKGKAAAAAKKIKQSAPEKSSDMQPGVFKELVPLDSVSRYSRDLELYHFLKQVQELNSWFDDFVSKVQTEQIDVHGMKRWRDLEQKEEAVRLLQTVEGKLSKDTINVLCDLVRNPHGRGEEISQVLSKVGQYLSTATSKERAPPSTHQKTIDGLKKTAALTEEVDF